MRQKTPIEKFHFLRSFTNITLGKDGLNANMYCPFCKSSNKNKLKMIVHLEKNIYHCWVCDKKGSNINYLISRIDKTKSKEAERFFKKKYKKTFDLGLDFDSLFGETHIEEEVEKVSIPNGFNLLVGAYNSTHPDIRDVFKYALKRGASKHKFWFLRLGYSLDSEFSRCLILPSLDDNGEINFYTSRKIDADTTDSFKYKNANIKKSTIIFNELNIDWSQRLTIVEGPLDLLKTNDNSTCLLGSSLTEDMLLFKRIIENKTPVALALDSDAYYKTLKIARCLYSYGIDVKIVDTRGPCDVGDMSQKHFESLLEDARVYEEQDNLLAKIASL